MVKKIIITTNYVPYENNKWSYAMYHVKSLIPEN